MNIQLNDSKATLNNESKTSTKYEDYAKKPRYLAPILSPTNGPRIKKIS
jgi:hypothetical protein